MQTAFALRQMHACLTVMTHAMARVVVLLLPPNPHRMHMTTIMTMVTMVTATAIRSGHKVFGFLFSSPFLDLFLCVEAQRWCPRMRLIVLLETFRSSR